MKKLISILFFTNLLFNNLLFAQDKEEKNPNEIGFSLKGTHANIGTSLQYGRYFGEKHENGIFGDDTFTQPTGKSVLLFSGGTAVAMQDEAINDNVTQALNQVKAMFQIRLK